MPTYNYKCPKDDCDEELHEVFHKLDEAGPKCPKHPRTDMVKMLTAPAFHLKGGGWYKDGYSSTPNASSVDAKEVGEGIMHHAREGAKAGGHKEGERRVREYQAKLARETSKG